MTLPSRTLLALRILVRHLAVTRRPAVVEPAAPVREALLPVGLALGAVGGGGVGGRGVDGGGSVGLDRGAALRRFGVDARVKGRVAERVGCVGAFGAHVLALDGVELADGWSGSGFLGCGLEVGRGHDGGGEKGGDDNGLHVGRCWCRLSEK
jgi:hypothetical protein